MTPLASEILALMQAGACGGQHHWSSKELSRCCRRTISDTRGALAELKEAGHVRFSGNWRLKA